VQSDVTNLGNNESASVGIPRQSASSFFSNVPWLLPKAAPSNTQSTKLDLKQSVPESQSLRPAKPVGGYFQALPWQVKPASKGADSFSVSGSHSEGVSGIFAAATQSALRASQKGERINIQPDNQGMEKFFGSLPWSGNG
jgi:hypothetical protein